MRVLGIETSCDETSAAVVENGKILSNIVSSQVKLHEAYGGVVPEIASRQHLKWIDHVVQEACEQASAAVQKLDAIAVTRGPGLPSALLVGVSAARGLAARWRKPLVPIHHMEAHLYSAEIQPPFVALIVSGGHTMLVFVPEFGEQRVLGQTADDAAGEAFDKAAQLLGLGYPGGPCIERESKKGDPRAFDFPRPMMDSSDWNFSFSGLKTALRRTLQKLGALDAKTIADLSASFQMAIIEVLVEKTIRVAKSLQVSQITLSGGVGCNEILRSEFEERCQKEGFGFVVTERSLCTDNAAMIALLAEKKLIHGFQPLQDWDIEPDWILR